MAVESSAEPSASSARPQHDPTTETTTTTSSSQAAAAAAAAAAVAAAAAAVGSYQQHDDSRRLSVDAYRKHSLAHDDSLHHHPHHHATTAPAAAAVNAPHPHALHPHHHPHHHHLHASQPSPSPTASPTSTSTSSTSAHQVSQPIGTTSGIDNIGPHILETTQPIGTASTSTTLPPVLVSRNASDSSTTTTTTTVSPSSLSPLAHHHLHSQPQVQQPTIASPSSSSIMPVYPTTRSSQTRRKETSNAFASSSASSMMTATATTTTIPRTQIRNSLHTARIMISSFDMTSIEQNILPNVSQQRVSANIPVFRRAIVRRSKNGTTRLFVTPNAFTCPAKITTSSQSMITTPTTTTNKSTTAIISTTQNVILDSGFDTSAKQSLESNSSSMLSDNNNITTIYGGGVSMENTSFNNGQGTATTKTVLENATKSVSSKTQKEKRRIRSRFPVFERFNEPSIKWLQEQSLTNEQISLLEVLVRRASAKLVNRENDRDVCYPAILTSANTILGKKPSRALSKYQSRMVVIKTKSSRQHENGTNYDDYDDVVYSGLDDSFETLNEALSISPIRSSALVLGELALLQARKQDSTIIDSSMTSAEITATTTMTATTVGPNGDSASIRDLSTDLIVRRPSQLTTSDGSIMTPDNPDLTFLGSALGTAHSNASTIIFSDATTDTFAPQLEAIYEADSSSANINRRESDLTDISNFTDGSSVTGFGPISHRTNLHASTTLLENLLEEPSTNGESFISGADTQVIATRQKRERVISSSTHDTPVSKVPNASDPSPVTYSKSSISSIATEVSTQTGSLSDVELAMSAAIKAKEESEANSTIASNPPEVRQTAIEVKVIDSTIDAEPVNVEITMPKSVTPGSSPAVASTTAAEAGGVTVTSTTSATPTTKQPSTSKNESSVASSSIRSLHRKHKSGKSRSHIADTAKALKELPVKVYENMEESKYLDLLSLLPPITRFTLRELDFNEILGSAQLRHDLFFDPELQFKPNSDGEKGEIKKAAADSYWKCVESELRHGHMYRVPLLLFEIRAIILELIPQVQKEEIMHGIDVNLIEQEIQHGAMNPVMLVNYIGNLLKQNCAPARDHMVDQMVNLCSKGELIPAIRACYEVLESMKLDYANHQLGRVRPYVVEHAVEFEQRHFQDLFRRERSSLTATRNWIKSNLPHHDLEQLHREALLNLISQAHLIDSAESNAIQLPETLRMDLPRLIQHYNDWQDSTIMASLLVLYRQVTGASCKPSDMMDMKHVLWVLLNDGETSMQHVVLQMCDSAGKVRGKPIDEREQKMIGGLVESTLQPGSKLYEVIRVRVGQVLKTILNDKTNSISDAELSKVGLLEMKEQIKTLSERINLLCSHNYKVFKDTYLAIVEAYGGLTIPEKKPIASTEVATSVTTSSPSDSDSSSSSSDSD